MQFLIFSVCLITILTGSGANGQSYFGSLLGGSTAEPDTIANAHITNWGSWGEWDQCPFGTFAHSYQLKVEPYSKTADNTALNGVNLFCAPPGSSQDNRANVTSKVGSKGEWGPVVSCGGEPITGFRIEGVPYKGSSWKLWKTDIDDVGTIAVNAYSAPDALCSNPAVVDYVDAAGTWTQPKFCEEGFAVCGIKTQVDDAASSDQTGLNNIIMKCCNH